MKNHRYPILVVLLVLLTVWAGAAFAQETERPQAVVSVERTVLRETPSEAGAFVSILEETERVILLSVSDDGLWLHVETVEGVEGWGRALHFSPLSRARALRTLVLFEEPNDNINYVTGVDENAEVLILGTDETGAWSQVIAPDGAIGWTETLLLRFDYGIALLDGIELYDWPGSTTAAVVATINAQTPVFIKDTLATDGWIRVETGAGEEGWTRENQFTRTNNVTPGMVTLTEGEAANLRSLPAVDSPASGNVPNGTEIQIVGRTGDGRWLLIATPDGQLAWVSRGLIEIGGGAELANIAVVTP